MRADAIVLLGCRVTPTGQPAAALARRVRRAKGAFVDGDAPIVIASGGRKWGDHIEARVMRDELVASGVPAGAVIEELCSLSTFENAIFASAILRRLVARSGDGRAPRASIVTCAWHMDRALESFRAAGVDAVASPAIPPPMGLLDRLRLGVHEAVCKRLDARAMARAGMLGEHAATFEEARG